MHWGGTADKPSVCVCCQSKSNKSSQRGRQPKLNWDTPKHIKNEWARERNRYNKTDCIRPKNVYMFRVQNVDFARNHKIRVSIGSIGGAGSASASATGTKYCISPMPQLFAVEQKCKRGFGTLFLL